MENRFEHTPPEEEQGWGAYATPPPRTGLNNSKPLNASQRVPGMPHDLNMCSRFAEHLPAMLENSDGEMSPETLRAMYGHMSICEACSSMFDEHQRITALLDSMPMAELPMDFSGVVQRRIELNAISSSPQAVVASALTGRPFVQGAASDANSIKKRNLTVNAAAVSGLKKTQVSSTVSQNVTAQQSLMQRLTAGSIVAAVMAFFVSTSWGQAMLGQNLTAVRTWLGQMSHALGKIPLFGSLALLVFGTLAEMADLLGSTYRTVGDMAVRGLAMDIGVCVAAYYFLVVRKQKDGFTMRRY
jgi:hypothetical protein